jgi:hypothetical protein
LKSAPPARAAALLLIHRLPFQSDSSRASANRLLQVCASSAAVPQRQHVPAPHRQGVPPLPPLPFWPPCVLRCPSSPRRSCALQTDLSKAFQQYTSCAHKCRPSAALPCSRVTCS